MIETYPRVMTPDGSVVWRCEPVSGGVIVTAPDMPHEAAAALEVVRDSDDWLRDWDAFEGQGVNGHARYLGGVVAKRHFDGSLGNYGGFRSLDAHVALQAGLRDEPIITVSGLRVTSPTYYAGIMTLHSGATWLMSNEPGEPARVQDVPLAGLHTAYNLALARVGVTDTGRLDYDDVPTPGTDVLRNTLINDGTVVKFDMFCRSGY